MSKISRNEFLGSFSSVVGYYNRPEILDNNLGLRAWYRQSSLVSENIDELEVFFEFILSNYIDLPAPAIAAKVFQELSEKNNE